MGHALTPPSLHRAARAVVRRRPVDAVWLAALFAGAAVCLLTGILFPMSEHAPLRLGGAMLVVALAMSAGTLAWGDRLPSWALLAEAVVAATLNSVLVAFAHRSGGAMADGLAYLWLTAWVALFRPRWAGRFAGLCAAGFGAGLLASDVPRMAAGWLLLSLATWMLAVLGSRFSRSMRRHLRTDALTGALNRSGLAEIAERVPRRRRDDEQVVVAALDLDGFKAVNDRDGHAAGDRLLADATAAWREQLRGGDVLARTGGDEFVLVMPGTSDAEAAAVLERLRRSHPVAWSAGLTRWRDGESLERCLERADAQLYAAKAGRDAPRG
ncbi:MAG TPA: GGDEF domain-containing protein [Baekduia sp.]|nr:GGDEF domain-containing protein [Baekduia sp.]